MRARYSSNCQELVSDGCGGAGLLGSEARGSDGRRGGGCIPLGPPPPQHGSRRAGHEESAGQRRRGRDGAGEGVGEVGDEAVDEFALRWTQTVAAWLSTLLLWLLMLGT